MHAYYVEGFCQKNNLFKTCHDKWPKWVANEKIILLMS